MYFRHTYTHIYFSSTVNCLLRSWKIKCPDKPIKKIKMDRPSQTFDKVSHGKMVCHQDDLSDEDDVARATWTVNDSNNNNKQVFVLIIA